MKKLNFIVLTLLMCKIAFAQTLTQREIIKGVYTMGLPSNLEPTEEADDSNMISFTDGNYTDIFFHFTSNDATPNQLPSMLDHKAAEQSNYFQFKGDIDYVSDSGILFEGYYGYSSIQDRKTYKAYIFFDKPTFKNSKCMMSYLTKNQSAINKETIEHLLSTIKLIEK